MLPTFQVLQGREDVLVLTLPEVGDQAVLRSDHSSEIHRPAVLEAKARKRAVRDPEELVSHCKEAFARHAADVHAPAANRPAIDHQCLASFRSARIVALNAAASPPRITKSNRPAMRSPSVGKSGALA
jgi:hypothetical protein